MTTQPSFSEKQLTRATIDVIQVPQRVLERPFAHVAVEPRLPLSRARARIDDNRLVQVLVQLKWCLARFHQLGRFGQVLLTSRWRSLAWRRATEMISLILRE